MRNISKIYLLFFILWLIISGAIAYQAQFISAYLVHVRGMTQAEYEYPTQHVLTLCGYLGLLLLNVGFYLKSQFTQQHPLLSYLLCAILPILFSIGAIISTMHAPDYYFLFLFSILILTIFQLLFAPMVAYRIKTAISEQVQD